MSNPYDRANPFNTGTRADTFGIRPDLFKELQEVAPKKETIDRLVDSEQELNSRMDLLDPIMDFGQSYMPTDLRFTGTGRDRKSTRLNSSHTSKSRMPSSA